MTLPLISLLAEILQQSLQEINLKKLKNYYCETKKQHFCDQVIVDLPTDYGTLKADLPFCRGKRLDGGRSGSVQSCLNLKPSPHITHYGFMPIFNRFVTTGILNC
jgi:hypothetical protein